MNSSIKLNLQWSYLSHLCHPFRSCLLFLFTSSTQLCFRIPLLWWINVNPSQEKIWVAASFTEIMLFPRISKLLSPPSRPRELLNSLTDFNVVSTINHLLSFHVVILPSLWKHPAWSLTLLPSRRFHPELIKSSIHAFKENLHPLNHWWG